MTDKPLFSKEHLERTLSGLVVTLAERVGGKSLLIYTESEPFFCIERDTEKEAKDAAKEIIILYAKLHGEKVKSSNLILSERERVSPLVEKLEYTAPSEVKIKPIRQFISPYLDREKEERAAV